MADVYCDDNTCGICSKTLQDPHELPCGHIFCRHPCLLPQQNSPHASCPICCIQILAKDLIRCGTSAKQPLPPQLNLPTYYEQCPACHLNIVPGAVFPCFHCCKRICSDCISLHSEEMSSIVLNKVFALKRLRKQLVDLRESNAAEKQNSDKTILLGQLDEVSDGLENSCEKALKKAEQVLDDMEVQANAQLYQAFEDIQDLQEITKALQFNLANNAEPAELLLMQQQLNQVAAQMIHLCELADRHDKKCFEHISVSKIFKTIDTCVQGMQLVTLGGDIRAAFREKHVPPIANPVTPKPSSSGVSAFGNQNDPNKVMVTKLTPNITEDVLSVYFQRFGVVKDISRALNKNGQGVQSWCCITFEDEVSVLNVLQQTSYNILGNSVKVKPFFCNSKRKNMRSSQQQQSLSPSVAKPSTKPLHRIAVSNLSYAMTALDLETYFSSFGQVKCVVLDSTRPLAFVTFDSMQAAVAALSFRQHLLFDRLIQVNAAFAEPFVAGSRPLTLTPNNSKETAKESMFPHPDIDRKSVYLIGVDQSTTQKMLRTYFSHFGVVSDIIWNPFNQEAVTGHNWAIISFQEEVSVHCVLEQTRHNVGNSTVTARACRQVTREPRFYSEDEIDTKSIYLVGLTNKIKKKTMEAYFSHYGPIDHIMWNRSHLTTTGQLWAIITFRDELSVRKALQSDRHTFANVTVTVCICRKQIMSS